MKHTIYIFGEAHFHKDEVQFIRNTIIKINPTILLIECYEDKNYYNKYIPTCGIYKLDIDEENFKNKSLKDQFIIRESYMLAQIQKYQLAKQLCVVVGDTHLRTIKTKELGDVSPIYKWAIRQNNVHIIRSKYSEIE